MNDGLQALPAISIIKSGRQRFGDGDFHRAHKQRREERGFQDCGIKLVGGASVGSPKNNFVVTSGVSMESEATLSALRIIPTRGRKRGVRCDSAAQCLARQLLLDGSSGASSFAIPDADTLHPESLHVGRRNADGAYLDSWKVGALLLNGAIMALPDPWRPHHYLDKYLEEVPRTITIRTRHG